MTSFEFDYYLQQKRSTPQSPEDKKEITRLPFPPTKSLRHLPRPPAYPLGSSTSSHARRRSLSDSRSRCVSSTRSSQMHVIIIIIIIFIIIIIYYTITLLLRPSSRVAITGNSFYRIAHHACPLAKEGTVAAGRGMTRKAPTKVTRLEKSRTLNSSLNTLQ